MRPGDRARALRLVAEALPKVTDEQLRLLACAIVGHPPVVQSCMGQITCGRCGDIVGDTLAGATTLEGTAVVGHDCSECRKVCRGLKPVDRLLLEDAAEAFVKKMRKRAS